MPGPRVRDPRAATLDLLIEMDADEFNGSRAQSYFVSEVSNPIHWNLASHQIDRSQYVAWVKCPYRVAGKASALRTGKRAPG